MMKLILLGGNNVHNREWIESVRNKFSDLFDESVVLIYEHWKSEGKVLDRTKEIEKLSKIAGRETVIFAKSAVIGLTLQAILEMKIKPKKCIFVGLPLNWEEVNRNELSPYFIDYKIPTLFIQAEKDPYASFSDVKKFLDKNKVKNCELKEVAGEDHDYLDVDELKIIVKEFL